MCITLTTFFSYLKYYDMHSRQTRLPDILLVGFSLLILCSNTRAQPFLILDFPARTHTIYDYPCNSNRAIEQTTKDSLKARLKHFVNCISHQAKDSTINFSKTYHKLYSSRFKVTRMYNNNVFHQFCVQKEKGKLKLTEKQLLNIAEDFVSYNNGQFLILIKTHYYLGNNEFWIVDKEYFESKPEPNYFFKLNLNTPPKDTLNAFPVFLPSKVAPQPAKAPIRLFME